MSARGEPERGERESQPGVILTVGRSDVGDAVALSSASFEGEVVHGRQCLVALVLQPVAAEATPPKRAVAAAVDFDYALPARQNTETCASATGCRAR